MEAVPRLPMISFDIKVNTEIVSFASKLKPYISSFYHEDPESYHSEIHSLETLRAAAVRPSVDVAGCQLLKKYYCQLHFLKSRFPMEENQACAVYFSWRDNYSNMVCSVPDIDFELMNVLYDIGAVHSKLGAADSRVTPEGMKMACTHFQCAAWAFQTVREIYPQMVSLVLAPEVIHFMHLTCLAQAQECILEKSMMDNRKATIIGTITANVIYLNTSVLAEQQQIANTRIRKSANAFFDSLV